MNYRLSLLLITTSLITLNSFSQINSTSVEAEKDAVHKVLMDYVDGTAFGAPERIKNAFHKDLNLYSVQGDSLRIVNGQQYITYFKKGEKRDRVGRIVSIDVTNDAAVAKIEIDVASRKRLYTDYLLLLKLDGAWKIIHKSYTSQNY